MPITVNVKFIMLPVQSTILLGELTTTSNEQSHNLLRSHKLINYSSRTVMYSVYKATVNVHAGNSIMRQLEFCSVCLPTL